MKQIFTEKSEKVYLPTLSAPSIFVSEMINKHFFLTGKIKLAIILILTAGSVTVNWGQTLWPGDVNNNGVVNTVDILYWSYARGSVGPARSDQSVAWQEVNIDVQWGQIFPDETDYAYADCDGNGVVDDNDLEIIKNNFLFERALVERDTFPIGEEGLSPELRLTPDQEVLPSDAADVEVFVELGSQEMAIDSFFGIAFTIPYNKEIVSDQKNRTNYSLPNEELWFGNPPEDVKEVVINDTEAGKLHIAVYRKIGPVVSDTLGFGPMGSIVMEDIVFGSNTSLELNPADVKMVTKNFSETKVFPVGTLVITENHNTTSSKDIHKENKILLYPNPASNWISLEAKGKQNNIQAFELYNLLGRLVAQKQFDFPASQIRLNLPSLPTGLYLVKIKTESGFYTAKVKIENP